MIFSRWQWLRLEFHLSWKEMTSKTSSRIHSSTIKTCSKSFKRDSRWNKPGYRNRQKKKREKLRKRSGSRLCRTKWNWRSKRQKLSRPDSRWSNYTSTSTNLLRTTRSSTLKSSSTSSTCNMCSNWMQTCSRTMALRSRSTTNTNNINNIQCIHRDRRTTMTETKSRKSQTGAREARDREVQHRLSQRPTYPLQWATSMIRLICTRTTLTSFQREWGSSLGSSSLRRDLRL